MTRPTWNDADFDAYEVRLSTGTFMAGKDKVLEMAQAHADATGGAVSVYGYLRVTGFRRLVAQVQPAAPEEES